MVDDGGPLLPRQSGQPPELIRHVCDLVDLGGVEAARGPEQVEVPEEAEVIVHRLVDELGPPSALPDARSGDLPVPLHHDVHAVVGEQMRREADGLLDLALGLPWKTENERKIRPGRDAVFGQHACGPFERVAGRSFAHLSQALIVAALRSDKQTSRIRRDARDELMSADD